LVLYVLIIIAWPCAHGYYNLLLLITHNNPVKSFEK